MWPFRREFWNQLLTFKFRQEKPRRIPVPQRLDRPIQPVPFARAFPRTPISDIVVADYVPRDDRRLVALWFCKAQSWLSCHVSPMQVGLPPIDADPQAALAEAYTPAKRCYFPGPRRPPEYGSPVDLGGLAVASPYACYLEGDGNGRFHWDLRRLEGIDCHRGLRSPTAFVEFALVGSEGCLEATRIETELGVSVPGDADWSESQRIALCAVSTHLSLVRHFNWIHLVSGGPLGFVTRNHLPVDHPIARLLQPHVYGTESSNQMVTIVQMDPGGDFENTFSFTRGGICKLFEATYDDFDLESIEPSRDNLRRRLNVEELRQPALDNRIALMDLIHAHVGRYLALYFDSNESLVADEAMNAWCDALAERIPHGVAELIGSPMTIDGVVRLLSTLIYLTTVEHEIVGSGVWDYQLWDDVQPVRIYRNGQRPPLDVYQRLVNANFNLNVSRTPLMTDFSELALDARGKAAFRSFLSDLVDLQSQMDTEAPTCWRMEPRRLKASINA